MGERLGVGQIVSAPLVRTSRAPTPNVFGGAISCAVKPNARHLSAECADAASFHRKTLYIGVHGSATLIGIVLGGVMKFVDHGDDPGSYFWSIVEASQDCVRVLTMDGRVEYMNARGRALFEIEDFEQCRGRAWIDLWPDDSQESLKNALNAALSGKVQWFRAACPTARGHRKVWDTVVSPVLAPDGLVVRLLATSHDVTVEIQTRAMRDAIIELLPAPLLVKDADDGRYLLINRAAADVLGRPARDIVGRTAGELFPKNEAKAFALEDAAVITSGETAVSDAEPITTERGLRYFKTTKAAAMDATGARMLLTLAEDVTEARESADALVRALENAEKASQAKSDFLANMSHEIRTPLNAILGMAQAMAMHPMPDGQAERLHLIHQSSLALLELLNDVLDLAKVEAGRIDLEDGVVDVEILARDAQASFTALSAAKDLYFVIEVEPLAKGAWRGDPGRIRQILHNLVANAIKFTAVGSVQVWIGAVSGELVIRVSDTGIGIAEEQKTSVFEKFAQADSSTTRRFGGTGLGLAICKELTHAMKGHIDLDSTFGQGTTVTVRLPLPRCISMPDAPAPPSVPAKPGLRILLAEDNASNQLVMRALLEALDVDLSIAGDGDAALTAWRTSEFDLILMDVQMPVLDGLAAARAIRHIEFEQRRKPTPIVALTANVMTHQLEAYMDAGMDAVVAKPVQLAKLLDGMEQALAAHAPRP